MELKTISSVTAYAGSLKREFAVRGAIETCSAGSRSDTSAFSAEARAAARLCRRAVPGLTGEFVDELAGKINELAGKNAAENAQIPEQKNEQSELDGELARRMNEFKEAAEKTAAENAQKQAKSSSQTQQTQEKATVREADKAKDKNKTIAEMVKEQMEKIDSLFAEKEYDKSQDSRLSGIKAKMRTGGTLTPAEQQYLAAKDPDGYSVFQQIESSRKMYRCSLSACRTKDEVNSMRLSNALSALSAYRKAIREGRDGSAVAGLNAALEREIRSFMNTSDYRRLPTAAECDKFDRDLAKAKRNEREKKLAEKRRQEAKRKKTLAERRLAAKRARYKKTPGDGKMTVAQVMSSPTAKKVLAARAKRTYCGCAYAGDFKGSLYSKA